MEPITVAALVAAAYFFAKRQKKERKMTKFERNTRFKIAQVVLKGTLPDEE